MKADQALYLADLEKGFSEAQKIEDSAEKLSAYQMLQEKTEAELSRINLAVTDTGVMRGMMAMGLGVLATVGMVIAPVAMDLPAYGLFMIGAGAAGLAGTAASDDFVNSMTQRGKLWKDRDFISQLGRYHSQAADAVASLGRSPAFGADAEGDRRVNQALALSLKEKFSYVVQTRGQQEPFATALPEAQPQRQAQASANTLG